MTTKTTIDSSFPVKLKTLLGILISIIILCSATISINNYFAKNSDVQSLSKRLETGIISDQIFQTEMSIDKIRFYKRFEMRKDDPELSPLEEQSLINLERKLSELQSEREKLLAL